jgi:hypothetical protein
MSILTLAIGRDVDGHVAIVGRTCIRVDGSEGPNDFDRAVGSGFLILFFNEFPVQLGSVCMHGIICVSE